jgi:L-glyceraldehyde 3-phosphate reductase
MALAWVLRDGSVTSVIVGASKVEQIDRNVNAVENLGFSGEDLRQINEILAGEART